MEWVTWLCKMAKGVMIHADGFYPLGEFVVNA